MKSEIDYGDVQGLVRFGYKTMTEASYFLVRVRSAAAARSWLRSAPIANAVEKTPVPSTALQVAFTAAGLQALGVPPAILDGFSHEFVSGITEGSRSRRLGDVGSNAPSQWAWGAPSSEPHLLIMFFAAPGHLNGLVQSSMDAAWNAAFDKLGALDTSDLGGYEQFGFKDGISQPEIDWLQQRQTPTAQIDYTNIVSLGEFLLGYRNEYGKYTDRPLVNANAVSAGLLPAEDAPEKKDIGRNGTYLVLRDLRQDVRGFWQFIHHQSNSDPPAFEKMAAAFVGRTRDGEPLNAIQEQAIPGIGTDADQIRQNQFTFDKDSTGSRCPFGAHVRRANPRNTDFPGHPTGLSRLLARLGLGRNRFRDDLMSSVRFHRILRRGREYGPGLSPADALAPAPANDPERGLRFVCLNANILRQFEFIQSAWIMSTKFAGLTGESDPLLGNRQAIPGCPVTDDFNMPQEEGPRRRISGLPQFVRVCGGAYFFLPSLSVVRYFATAPAA